MSLLQSLRKFQSLIGTLQTVLDTDCKLSPIQFQSLIGTLQTSIFFAGIVGVAWFQSLIGTLQTWNCGKESTKYVVCFNPL